MVSFTLNIFCWNASEIHSSFTKGKNEKMGIFCRFFMMVFLKIICEKLSPSAISTASRDISPIMQ